MKNERQFVAVLTAETAIRSESDRVPPDFCPDRQKSGGQKKKTIGKKRGGFAVKYGKTSPLFPTYILCKKR